MNRINLDIKLLSNFYKNKGFYDVKSPKMHQQNYLIKMNLNQFLILTLIKNITLII